MSNQYLQQIYRERRVAAEAAAERVREQTQAILERWRQMGAEGVLYTVAQRNADSKKLEEASQEFEAVLAAVYEIEDNLRNESTAQ